MKRRKGTVRWLAVACLFCLLLSGCQNAGNADNDSAEVSETMETKTEEISEQTVELEETKTPDAAESPEETKAPDAVKTPEKKAEVSNVCPDCNGTGIVCSECNGTTIVNCKACNQTGYESCGVCKGTNVISCHHCKGSGKEAAPQNAPNNGTDTVDGQAQQQAPAFSVSFVEGETTDIEEMLNDNDDCIEETYDLNGRRILTITRPGIYVKGGKKIIKK